MFDILRKILILLRYLIHELLTSELSNLTCISQNCCATEVKYTDIVMGVILYYPLLEKNISSKY